LKHEVWKKYAASKYNAYCTDSGNTNFGWFRFRVSNGYLLWETVTKNYLYKKTLKGLLALVLKGK